MQNERGQLGGFRFRNLLAHCQCANPLQNYDTNAGRLRNVLARSYQIFPRRYFAATQYITTANTR